MRSFWVVEFKNPDHPNTPFYFSGGHSTEPTWTSDINKAIKFFGEEDSDAMIDWRFNTNSVKSKEVKWND